MRYALLFMLILINYESYAAAPSTSCPTGYVQIKQAGITLNNGSCPSGYTSVGTTETCLSSPANTVCFLFAPANTNYTDISGTYQFTQPCPYIDDGSNVDDGGNLT